MESRLITHSAGLGDYTLVGYAKGPAISAPVGELLPPETLLQPGPGPWGNQLDGRGIGAAGVYRTHLPPQTPNASGLIC